MSDSTSPIPAPPDSAPTAVDLTAPLPVRRSRLAPNQLVLVVVAIAAAAFLVGLVVGAATPRGDRGTVLAAANVGPDGRTVRFEGGRITFPRGAVDRTVGLVVRSVPIRERLRVSAGSGAVVVDPGDLQAFRFEPTDLTFRRPVEISFDLPRGTRRATVFVRHDEGTVLLRGTVDPIRDVATIRVLDLRFEER